MRYVAPNVNLSIELTENLQNIDKIIDLLNEKRDSGISQDLLDNLKKQLLIKQVYHSNAIEGNKLSLRETELILNGMVINDRPLKDEIEARSLANATDYLYTLIDGREALTKRTLLELHTLIMKDIPGINAGQFRKEEVQISNSKHIPPFFTDVEDHVDELFQWMNRNSHKYPPLIMGAILHHWMTWIHPFSDGNGRVSRMFLNFYLLQKGYPEIIIKISNRDVYYDALVAGDNHEIAPMVDLFAENIRETIAIYEELINEDQRQKEWLNKFKSISIEKYQEVKSKHSFDYEVWKNQMLVFRTLFKKTLSDVDKYLENLEINFREYDIISFSQYLDILEDRGVSNTWFMIARIFDKEKKEAINLIFYFERLYRSKILQLEGNDKNQKRAKKRNIPPTIKLYISARKNGLTIDLDKSIDLVNIGTYKDQLSFGIVNRKEKREAWQKPKLDSKTENPGIIIRKFIEQFLELYFEIKIA